MNCVYHASSIEQADIIIAWLADRGIPAFVKNRNMAGAYATLAVAPKGIEVCVLDQAQADQAKALLAAHERDKGNGVRPPPGQMIHARCAECGRETSFPSELYGTVQTCPGCRLNMDVVESPQVC